MVSVYGKLASLKVKTDENEEPMQQLDAQKTSASPVR
ncbi:predicted protein [Plenodomus lingam JN3]|uniref:Predicted protein n=1 Tax=Leptosphaeria maculans (strain JN3 / isolate v23.1.3 / race Av1-4-5-6-7-8) TaxID=985895 RepID=E4ZN27_LEPMJ|nr:predicted protein [Plenodomus lingam JN3]CBX92630.1 predicted protein [Plenodomus lingam JN3]